MSRARRQRQDGFRPKLIALSVAAAFSLSATQSLANPSGGSVAPGGGTASFTAAGNTLTITNSANAIINWASFSIGVNEITRFLQSSSASAVLNRVVGSGGVIPQSVIDGILSSNGRVFLLNQSGVVIGPTATIDVAGLVASSLNLSDHDFRNGRMHFTTRPGTNPGGVSNAGLIDTTNAGPLGRVFLIAPDVENSGIIRTPQGQIVLAAGKSVELVQESSPFVTVKVTAGNEQALNLSTGILSADSGRIDMAAALVRNTGVVAANSAVVGANGEIRLVATKDVTLDAGSTTSANGPSGGKVLIQAQTGTALVYGNVSATGSSGQGGTVQALGVRVGVLGNGVIDASGDTGGGTVLVGGDEHGANPDVQNAQQALIGPDAIIRADAGTTGDGGRVIVWSDQYTQFYGNISARGGAQSGNGGFVETSGEQSLLFAGLVDTRAPNGTTGSLLLDPAEITITHANSTSDSNITPTLISTFVDTTASPPATLSDTTINLQLSTTSVTVQTSTGDINIDGTGVAIAPVIGGPNNFLLTLNSGAAITWTSSGWSYTNGPGGTLSLNAATNINGNGGTLSANGSSEVFLTANNGSIADLAIAAQGGQVVITANAGSIVMGGFDITTYGGQVNLAAPVGSVSVGNINTSGPSGGGPVSIGFFSNPVYGDISTGNITTSGTSDDTSGGNVRMATSTGNITITGAIDTHGTNGQPSSAANNGGNGGSVTLQPLGAGSVAVYGSILSYGGDASTNDSGFGGNGGFAGDVTISGAALGTCTGECGGPIPVPLSGDIFVQGSITAHGGNGADTSNNGSGGFGNGGGSVTLLASGNITVGSPSGNIDVSGGNGGNATNSSIANFGGSGSSAGSVNIEAGQAMAVYGSVLAYGGLSGAGTYGGSGGDSFSSNGGSVTLTGSSVMVTGDILAYGGSGGAGGAGITGSGGNGGDGGQGGLIKINGGTTISTGAILAYGGTGGNGGSGASGSTPAGNGGNGGSAQSVTLTANPIGGAITVTGAIDVSGGGGGAPGTTGNNVPTSGALGTTGTITLTGDTVTWFVDNFINSYAITATSLFNWVPETPGQGADVTAGFFNGISAPLIRIGNTAMTGNIAMDGANVPVSVSTPLSLVTQGLISQSGNFSATSLNADGNAGVALNVDTLGMGVSTLTLQGRSNGPFTVANTGGINIATVDTATPAGLTTTGPSTTLASSSSGSITQTDPINATGSLTAVAGAGSVILNNPNNRIASLSTAIAYGGDVAVLNASGSMAIGTVFGNNITLTSDAITVTGTIATPGTLEYSTENPATPISPPSTFFSSSNAGVIEIGDPSLSNTGGISLSGAAPNAPVLDLLTSGPISSSGAIVVPTLVALGSDVSLGAPNNVGTLVATASAGNITFNNLSSLNVGAAATGNVALTVSGDIAGGVTGTSVSLTANGAIGAPGSPFAVVTTGLGAQAANGITIEMTSANGLPVPVSQLQNTATGDILLNAHGGVITNSLVRNNGGDVTINTFSPMTISAGIDAAGSIILCTGGAACSGGTATTGGVNDMTLTGPFTFNTATGQFDVTIGPTGNLTLNPAPSVTPLVLTAELFPNPFDITKFVFLGSSTLLPQVQLAVDTSTNSTNQLSNQQGTVDTGDNQQKQDDKKKGAATCK